MKHKLWYTAAVLIAASLTAGANASPIQFNFTGPGVSGSVALTFGSGTDAKYPQALEVTGISGTFSDANIGIVNAAILGLVSISPSSPEPGNLLAPADFSRFSIMSGSAEGGFTYDNLFYPGGSPQTASSYPPHGGLLDIYGLLFSIGNNGEVVDLWSNGDAGSGVDYGVAVATSAQQLDYVAGGVEPTPEPGSFLLLGTGLLAAAFVWWRPSLLRRHS